MVAALTPPANMNSSHGRITDWYGRHSLVGLPERERAMSRNLLVIDDDEVGCRLISAIFSPLGYHVIAAHDGPSGLTRVAAESPELVILDLRLPGMTGLETLERIRVTDQALPVIVLTPH